MNLQDNEIKKNLQQFSGSETVYSFPLINTRYTEGMKYLATAADAYWLITDVSVIAKSLMRKSYFITIDFKRLPIAKKGTVGHEAEIAYSDGNGNIFETHRYEVTDFPLDELRLFFVNGTLMLPGEY